MNVIYSGIFNINWEYYSDDAMNWSTICKRSIEKYANSIGSSFKYIKDDSRMEELFQKCRKYIPKLNTWSIGTLIKRIAIQDFLSSEYDNMVWIDTDIIINKYIDLFAGDLSRVLIDHNNYYENEAYNIYKKDFVVGYTKTCYKTTSNSGIFVMSKNVAQQYTHFLDIMKCDALNVRDLMLMNNYFVTHNLDHSISDEATMDAFINHYGANSLSNVVSTQYIMNYDPLLTPLQIRQTIKDVFAIHFLSNSKRYIEKIYE